MTFEECAKKMGHILQELQMEIGKYRSGGGLETKWKHKVFFVFYIFNKNHFDVKTDKTNRHLEALLKMIEYRDTKRYDEK